MINSQKLKGIIVGVDGNQQNLSKRMEISLSTLSSKINGHTEFTASEIAFIINRYNLDDKEIKEIFYK